MRLYSHARGWVCVFLLSISLCTSAEELDELWSESTRAYEAGDYSKTTQTLEQWIRLAEARGIRSPEAHKNIALAYWKQSAPGPAAFHIMKEASLRSSPARILGGISGLRQIQKEIGASSNAAEQPHFYFRFLVNASARVWLFTLGAWSFLGLLLSFYRPQKFEWLGLKTYRLLTVLFALICFGAGGVSLADRFLGNQYAVLSGFDDVWLFEEANSAKRLVEMPSGTIVMSTGNRDSDFVEISYPISAWVRTESLLESNPPL